MYMYWLVRFTGKDDGIWRLGSDLPWHVHLYTLTIVYPSDNVPFPSLPRQFIWIIHCSDVPYVPIFLVTLGLAFWGVGIGHWLKLSFRKNESKHYGGWVIVNHTCTWCGKEPAKTLVFFFSVESCLHKEKVKLFV